MRRHDFEDLQYQGPDPLELARQQLDFGAVAASTPPVKAILFKAQSMAPMVGPRPSLRNATPAVAGMLVLTLAFVPWVPITSTMSVLRITFEERMERRDAQGLVSGLLKGPAEAVLAARFAPDAGIDDVPGYLQMSVTGFDSPVRKLQEQYLAAVKQRNPEAVASVALEQQYSITRHRSPVALAYGAFRGDGSEGIVTGPGAELGHEVLTHVDLLHDALGERLRRLDPSYQLVDLKFIDSGSPDASGYDFVASAWPLPLGVTVWPYANLTAGEQASIRGAVEDFLDRVNLDQGVEDFASLPSAGLPIQVLVLNKRGEVDPFLSSHLQALIEQPRPEQLRSISFNVQSTVSDAMGRFLPTAEYRLDYNASPTAGRGAQPQFLVTVTITGELSADEIKSIREDFELDEQSAIDEAAGIDW